MLYFHTFTQNVLKNSITFFKDHQGFVSINFFRVKSAIIHTFVDGYLSHV